MEWIVNKLSKVPCQQSKRGAGPETRVGDRPRAETEDSFADTFLGGKRQFIIKTFKSR